MDWKIWYEDGSSFSNEDGSAEEAPALGVMLIAQENEATGRFNQSGGDYYVQRDGRWFGVDIFGLFDWLMEHSSVKFGRTVDSKKFRAVYDMAEADTDFPKRSAHLRTEKKL